MLDTVQRATDRKRNKIGSSSLRTRTSQFQGGGGKHEKVMGGEGGCWEATVNDGWALKKQRSRERRGGMSKRQPSGHSRGIRE